MTTAAHRPARTLRFVAALVLALQLAGTATATPAHAINPPQRTVKGTVDALYPWINYFSYHVVSTSGRGYRSPGVGYADGRATHFTNGCSIYEHHIAGYCQGDVYVHLSVNQSKIDRLGDYAAGFWMAHEFGHHVAASMGHRFSKMGGELFADCFAGAFTRYAYDWKMLDGNDVWEGYWTLGDAPYPAEGTGPTGNGYPSKALRQGWFLWGFNSYSVTGCATHAAGV